jgi:hypothetical protein
VQRGRIHISIGLYKWDLERLDDWDQIRGQCQGTRQRWELSRLTRDPRRNHAPAPNLPGLVRALDSSEASGTLQERRQEPPSGTHRLPARAASVAKCGALTPAHWHTFFLAPPFVGEGGTQARFPIGAILQDLAQLQAPKDSRDSSAMTLFHQILLREVDVLGLTTWEILLTPRQ